MHPMTRMHARYAEDDGNHTDDGTMTKPGSGKLRRYRLTHLREVPALNEVRTSRMHKLLVVLHGATCGL